VVIKGFILASVFFALAAGPALAKPTVIAELGTAPLLGTSTSTAEMRARVARNEGIVSAAAVKLGLSAGEYAQFHAAIDQSHVAWVTVPRHLEAMSWQGGGKVYVLHDVIIPAGTHGWEVDVPSHGQILALYMPAKCGNLSLVRKQPKVIAHIPRRLPVVTTAVVEAPAIVVAATPPVVVPDDTPTAAPVAVAQTAFPPAPVVHHSAIFLAPLLFGLAALSGGSGSGPIVPLPVGCP
jgi:hypothetical protein